MRSEILTTSPREGRRLMSGREENEGEKNFIAPFGFLGCTDR